MNFEQVILDHSVLNDETPNSLISLFGCYPNFIHITIENEDKKEVGIISNKSKYCLSVEHYDPYYENGTFCYLISINGKMKGVRVDFPENGEIKHLCSYHENGMIKKSINYHLLGSIVEYDINASIINFKTTYEGNFVIF